MFGIRTVKLFLYMKKKGTEQVLMRQLLKSGTSIGANIEEAVGASSQRDFIYKLDISCRETRETIFWLKLLRDTQILEQKIAASMLKDSEELARIIGSIQKSIKSRNNKTTPNS
ncbi:four helix bundle protein [Chitinophaga eiseniae]|uniref:Four helix bundle protein n=1 Tax=Chitinophaga eiseniae TaxID=634771 RepID=A0A1T4QUF1_9BACT|nr:four helix bundle protein [Chitinophaga eiseniae]SKA07314.1 four helix bundle protein [Chitinophaga eiseniae]